MASETDRPRRWPRALLIGSLALNVLVIGLAAGAMFRFDRDHRRDRPPPGSVGIAMMRELPREDQRAIRRALKASWQQSRADDAALLSLLRAEELDIDEVSAILDRQSGDRMLGMQSAQDIWLERVRAMSVSERVAYADRIAAALERRKKWKHKRQD